MEVKREGYLITFDKLDKSEFDGLRIVTADFIRIEKAEMYSNLWKMDDGSYTIDIYYEREAILKRFEEFLNEHGFVLRLTPKKITVG